MILAKIELIPLKRSLNITRLEPIKPIIIAIDSNVDPRSISERAFILFLIYINLFEFVK